ncbi:isoprenylcysteine carboxylmethyltransferase family protein [Phanerochaete sordida]|uniref:Protein-S-isoprenylcysteine O-methyltransferase n=1 Tax=Phanerochaete sordida TaxID=48140 RepID=A0A9P3G5Y5_9APHY|nr:isoprenylcysteine carboxylmethyltransferase family protein [Phanerochaete sordida]
MSSLVKAAVLLVSAATFFHGLKPPTPAVEKERHVYKGQPFEYLVHAIAYASRAAICAAFLGHVYVMLSLDYFPAKRAELLPVACPNHSVPLATLAEITPAFVVGAALILAGGYLRLWCYRTLGKYFTFQVTILEDHQLVTGGPYALVRHPSYTGACMMILGATIMLFAGDGFVVACRVQDTPAVWLTRAWRVLAPYTVFGLVRRSWVEDAQLKKNFGVAWESYRQSVPYLFVPYVL